MRFVKTSPKFLNTTNKANTSRLGIQHEEVLANHEEVGAASRSLRSFLHDLPTGPSWLNYVIAGLAQSSGQDLKNMTLGGPLWSFQDQRLLQYRKYEGVHKGNSVCWIEVGLYVCGEWWWKVEGWSNESAACIILHHDLHVKSRRTGTSHSKVSKSSLLLVHSKLRVVRLCWGH